MGATVRGFRFGGVLLLLLRGVGRMIIAIDLDIPICFVFDDRRGGFCDAIQTPGLYSFGFGVVDAARGVKGLCVGGYETKIALAMGPSRERQLQEEKEGR